MMRLPFKRGDIIYGTHKDSDFNSPMDFGTFIYLGEAFDEGERCTRSYLSYVFSTDDTLNKFHRSRRPSMTTWNGRIYANCFPAQTDMVHIQSKHLDAFYRKFLKGDFSLSYAFDKGRVVIVTDDEKLERPIYEILELMDHSLVSVNPDFLESRFARFENTFQAFNHMTELNRFDDVTCVINIGPAKDVPRLSQKEEMFRYYDEIVSGFLNTYKQAMITPMFNPPHISL